MSGGAAGRVEAALARIDAADGAVRAFISVLPQSARAEAAASDARAAAGNLRGPLDGVPVAVKDNIAVAGVATSCGTWAFPEPAAADAEVVARLRAAGAVIVGSLNMHEGALGATTDNPFHGRCVNPLRNGFTPGGSSGGSAAAVAAGMVPVTLGTDTMGSVRIPAAYCGLWGLKPTRGAVPVAGLVCLSWTLDAIGPLARSPGEIGEVMGALVDGWAEAAPVDPATLRLGVPDAAALTECEPVVLEGFEAALSALSAAGATLVLVEVAGWAPGALRHAGLLVSEVEGAEVLGEAVEGPGLSDGFRAMLRYGRDANAGRLARAYRILGEVAAAFDAAVAGVDALLLPTAPQRAFAHGGPVPANQADFTALANAAGAPALTMPLAAPDGGLPCAAQIMGRRGTDARLLAIGKAMRALGPLADWEGRG